MSWLKPRIRLLRKPHERPDTVRLIERANRKISVTEPSRDDNQNAKSWPVSMDALESNSSDEPIRLSGNPKLFKFLSEHLRGAPVARVR